MAVQKVTRREIEKEQGLHGGAPEDNSGANYSNVKCDFQVKGDLNVRCKLRAKRNSPKMIKGPGFVAFGDDYRVAKQHPPKHNWEKHWNPFS